MQRHFEEVQRAIRDGKWRMNVKRAMAIQTRNKIKPTSMNPDLLTMSRIRGGDAADLAAPVNFYWPSSS
jgi:hypothetical protein